MSGPAARAESSSGHASSAASLGRPHERVLREGSEGLVGGAWGSGGASSGGGAVGPSSSTGGVSDELSHLSLGVVGGLPSPSSASPPWHRPSAPSNETEAPVPSYLTAEYYDRFLMDDDAGDGGGASGGLDGCLDDESKCVVCIDRQRDTLLLPCGHLVLCGVCLDRGMIRGMCPFCREKVEETHCLS